jgi:hypothetical protein
LANLKRDSKIQVFVPEPLARVKAKHAIIKAEKGREGLPSRLVAKFWPRFTNRILNKAGGLRFLNADVLAGI